MKQQYKQVFSGVVLQIGDTLSGDPQVRTILIIKLRHCFLHSYSLTSVQQTFPKTKCVILQQAVEADRQIKLSSIKLFSKECCKNVQRDS